MTVAVPGRKESTACSSPLTTTAAAALPVRDVLDRLESSLAGLPEDEARQRLVTAGPNAVRSHRARAWPVLARQLRSPLLVLRDGHPRDTDVTELVPGDVVGLQLGQVVPADLRLLAAAGLECGESVLTGESLPAEKTPAPVPAGTPLAELTSSALMGTVVRAGSGTGVVVATGGQAEFGRIALGLGQRQPETEFQAGLRRFSMLLVQVAGVLTAGISSSTWRCTAR